MSEAVWFAKTGWISRAVSIDILYFDVRVLDNLTIASRVMLPLPSV